MPLTGCCGCLKEIVVLVNLIFMLVGLFVLALTSYAYWYMETNGLLEVIEEQHSFLMGVYILLVVIGVAMTILGFLGCCGALKESQCMLTSFFLVILVILATQVFAVVWSLMNPQSFRAVVQETVKTAIQESYAEVVPLREAVDTLQVQLHCCGAEGPGDWSDSTYNSIGGSKSAIDTFMKKTMNHVAYRVPKSCCETDLCRSTDGMEVLGIGSITGSIYEKGCVDAVMVDVVKHHVTFFLGALAVLFLIEILAMFCAMQLCCAIRRNGYGRVNAYYSSGK